MSRAADLRLLERTGALFAQLFFIAAGVYLGNRADAWKEERSHREAARATLENFRTEIRQNRASIGRVRPYQAALRDTLQSVLAGSNKHPMTAFTRRFRYNGESFHGIGGVQFSTTAWDLALATQALSYIEPGLAFRVADAYNQQRLFTSIQSAFLQSVFAPSTFADANEQATANALRAFLGDATYQEAEVARKYDRLLPGIDSALAKLVK